MDKNEQLEKDRDFLLKLNNKKVELNRRHAERSAQRDLSNAPLREFVDVIEYNRILKFAILGLEYTLRNEKL